MRNVNRQFDTGTAIATQSGRNATTLRAKEGYELDDATIAQFAPSVMASEKHLSRSAKYTFIPSNLLLTGMRAEGFFPVAVKTSGFRNADRYGFTPHIIRFRQTSYLSRPRKLNDSIPELALLNSHDGSTSYKLNFGFWRLVCLNGLTVADNSAFHSNVHVTHRGNVVENVVNASINMVKDIDYFVEKVERMKETPFNNEQAFDFAAKAKAIRFNKPDDVNVNLADLLFIRRVEDAEANLWTRFNTIQENLLKGGLPYSRANSLGVGRFSRTRPVNSISTDLDINTRLWKLAESYLPEAVN